MKIAAILGFIGLCLAQGPARADAAGDAKPSVVFKLLENKSDNTFRASLNLENTADEPYKDWTLHFSFVRPLIQVQGAELLQDADRNGDFFSIKATDPSQPLQPGQKVAIEMLGKWFLKHETDAPAGFFIRYTDKNGQPQLRKLTLESHIDDGKRIASPEASQAGEKPEFAIIPQPVELRKLPGSGFALSSATPILLQTKDAGAKEAAAFLRSLLPFTDAKSQGPAIRFLSASSATPEAYELKVTAQSIDIKAADAAGYHYAVQTLRQLLPAETFAHSSAKTFKTTVKAVAIKDHPRYAWRGLHLDVARNFHSVAEVKRLLDLMALHKLNQFHWHLTDDEGWRVAINAYPELTTIGAWRGYGLPLVPTLGSGPDKQGGFYAQSEIREVVAYAQARHITIIPEIDMPGHARAMLKSLPQLVDQEDRSTYESVQGYKDNVLSACIPATYEVMDRVIQEVAGLFPGPWLHVGGDEVPDGVWNPERSPQCKQTMAREGLQSKQQLENFFFKRIKQSVEKYGKRMAGWEEIIAGPGFPDRSVLTFAWKSSADSEKIAQLGYPVILNPADRLYFDLAYSEDPREPGYYWAGTINTEKVYTYPASALKSVRGIQGNLWSETIRSRQDLDYRAFPRVVALAEIAWTPPARQNWKSFSQRLERAHLPRLQAYGVQYRVAPGLSKLSSQP